MCHWSPNVSQETSYDWLSMMSGGRGRGRGQKVLSRPSADSFAVGRRQKPVKTKNKISFTLCTVLTRAIAYSRSEPDYYWATVNFHEPVWFTKQLVSSCWTESLHFRPKQIRSLINSSLIVRRGVRRGKHSLCLECDMVKMSDPACLKCVAVKNISSS
jgi:hypothetical protein